MTNAYYMHQRGNSYMPHTTKAKKGLHYKVVGMPQYVSPAQCLSVEAANLMWVHFDDIKSPELNLRTYAPPPADAQHSAQMALNTVDGIITDPSELNGVLEEITV